MTEGRRVSTIVYTVTFTSPSACRRCYRGRDGQHPKLCAACVQAVEGGHGIAAKLSHTTTPAVALRSSPAPYCVDDDRWDV